MAVFDDDDDFRTYINILKETKKTVPFALHHFVLMSNHVHLLLSPENPKSLSDIMHRINLGYSRSHKKRHAFIGQLWQGRYKSYLINSERYFMTCSIYIELNPVRAGMVRRPDEYAWSSHRAYVGLKSEHRVDPHPFYLELGRDERERALVYAAETMMWMEKPLDKKAAKKFFKEAGSF